MFIPTVNPEKQVFILAKTIMPTKAVKLGNLLKDKGQ